ncbi:MAG: nucleotide exchange factor GrpE [Acidobacteria bacterium]|nr:MAG: nucleotide exchange factor GrpE [Acidobacteriota bacterium]
MDDKEPVQFQVADRRFWVKDEGVFDRAEIPEKKFPSYVEELKGRTELAEQKLKEKLKKLEEDNDVFRERLTRETEKRLQREKRKLVIGLLDVVDNLERALKAGEDAVALKEGIRLNLDLFVSKLKSEGIEPLDPLNQPYNPHEAEAVGMVPVDKPELDHVVVEVLEKGYRAGEQLVRPARVRVGQYRGN